jgi:hypothetical protein
MKIIPLRKSKGKVEVLLSLAKMMFPASADDRANAKTGNIARITKDNANLTNNRKAIIYSLATHHLG